jgi:hypothetical protein
MVVDFNNITPNRISYRIANRHGNVRFGVWIQSVESASNFRFWPRVRSFARCLFPAGRLLLVPFPVVKNQATGGTVARIETLDDTLLIDENESGCATDAVSQE